MGVMDIVQAVTCFLLILIAIGQWRCFKSAMFHERVVRDRAELLAGISECLNQANTCAKLGVEAHVKGNKSVMFDLVAQLQKYDELDRKTNVVMLRVKKEAES